MAVTSKPVGSPSAPNSKTAESANSAATPNSKTAESAVSATIPNSKTAASVSSPAAPNSKTSVAVSNPAIPNSKTAASVSTAAIPNSKTVQSVVNPAITNAKTAKDVATALRSLTPLVDMNFAQNCYAQCGEGVEFNDLFTYARNSSATFINRRINCGKWEYFLDTDYVGNVTNLLTYSEAFDNAAWNKTRSSVTANAAKSPDGTFTADKLIEDSTSTNSHYLRDTITVVTATTYTQSIYAKYNTRQYLWIGNNLGNSGSIGAWFDLKNGAIGTIRSGWVAKMEDTGDGWFKCSVTGDSTSTIWQNDYALSDANSSISYTGDGSSGMHIWGAQLAVGAKPLPYVKTISSSVTQAFTESLRLEYDPASGESLGALIEGAATNLSLRSEEFDNASWVKIRSTITSNATVAPDGTTSADKLVQDSAATATHYVTQTATVVSGNSHTLSIYVKAAEIKWILLLDATTNEGYYFNISSGVIGSTVGSPDNGSIIDVGNGWFRCSVTVTTASTSLAMQVYQAESDLDNSFAVGDGSSGMYIWGAQVEALPFATSYIRTEGSAVSRVADDLSISGSLAVPALTSESKTYLAQINLPNVTPIGTFQTVFRTSESNQLIRIASDGVQKVSALHGSVSVASGSSLSAGVSHKIAYSLNSIDSVIRVYENGAEKNSAVGTNASGSLTVLQIGAAVGGASQNIFGNILNFSIYDEALTAAEVAAL